MLAGLTGWHVLVIALVVLLLFGATKLPALARGVGQSMRIFKQEIAPMRDQPAETGGIAGGAVGTAPAPASETVATRTGA